MQKYKFPFKKEQTRFRERMREIYIALKSSVAILILIIQY